jgi:hypothetical protein
MTFLLFSAIFLSGVVFGICYACWMFKTKRWNY